MIPAGSPIASQAIGAGPVAASSGNADLAGLTTATFITAGALNSEAALSGLSPLTFITAAALGGETLVGGAAPFTFTITAHLTGSGAGATDIAGAALLAFAPSALLIGDAPASGASTLTFTTTGLQVGDASIVGALALTFTTSATVDANGTLAGATTLTFTTSGVQTGDGSLGSATFPTFLTTGTLTGGALLSGASTLTFLTAGNASPGPADLVGATAFVFTTTATVEETPVVVPFRRGDDAGFKTSGQSRQYFYDKQIAEVENAARRLTSQRKTRVKRAAAVIEAFEPINLPSFAPPSAMAEIRQSIKRFKASEIDAIELRDLVLAHAEMARKRIRKRNEEAALVLLLAA